MEKKGSVRMKKVLALMMLLMVLLSACGQSGAAAVPTEIATEENGSKVTTYYEENGFVREVTEFPDGSIDETRYDAEGKLASNKYTDPYGRITECEFYPSSNFKVLINRNPDGSYVEEHFLDDGMVDWEEGTITAGTMYLRKTVTADGVVTEEYIEEPERHYEEDGSYWVSDVNGRLTFDTHYSADGKIMNSVIIDTETGTRTDIFYNAEGQPERDTEDDPVRGCYIEREYHPNGAVKKMETSYYNSQAYTLMEYDENDTVRYHYSVDEKGNIWEARYNAKGYYTYIHGVDSLGEYEYIADEDGNLLKYVDDGVAKEGDAIPAYIRENFALMQENTQQIMDNP